MADQWLPSGDWKRIQSPDGKVFYFNSTTNQTSWEPPTSPPASGTNATIPVSPQPKASTPIQNLSPPPPYQDMYGQATSQTTPNYSSYPQNPTSPNAGFYVPPTNNPPYDASPPSPPSVYCTSCYEPSLRSSSSSTSRLQIPSRPTCWQPLPATTSALWTRQLTAFHLIAIAARLGGQGSNLPRAIQSFSLRQFWISSSTRPKRDIPNGRNDAFPGS